MSRPSPQETRRNVRIPLAKSKNRDRRIFMPKNFKQPASCRAFTSPRLAAPQPEEPVVLDFNARARDFLKRITPLSADRRTRTLTLQKLRRHCQAEVRRLKARYTLATVKLALSKYRERDPRRRAKPLGLAP